MRIHNVALACRFRRGTLLVQPRISNPARMRMVLAVHLRFSRELCFFFFFFFFFFF
ncbi:MAG: hypothetical protein U0174_00670 [Polyangiaceae bacterium]